MAIYSEEFPGVIIDAFNVADDSQVCNDYIEYCDKLVMRMLEAKIDEWMQDNPEPDISDLNVTPDDWKEWQQRKEIERKWNWRKFDWNCVPDLDDFKNQHV